MKRIAWLVIAAQVAVLLWIAGEREWIRAQSPTVWLRTAPVDPRDPFRGDYVQLDYDIAALSTAQRQALTVPMSAARTVVYARLTTDPQGVAELVDVVTERPADGPYIRGQVGTAIVRDWQRNSEIAYGIEKYFVSQGSGLAIEQQRGARDDWQTPMEVEVALSSRGTPVIRGHRWSPLGIRLDVLEAPPARTGEAVVDGTRLSPKLRVRLRNQGDVPLLFADDPDHCAWQLIDLNSGGWNAAELASRDCDGFADRLDWHRLPAGGEYAFDIDFAEPAWWLRRDGVDAEIGGRDAGWAGYRLAYQPPAGTAPAQAGDAIVWRSRVRTARFAASGQID